MFSSPTTSSGNEFDAYTAAAFGAALATNFVLTSLAIGGYTVSIHNASAVSVLDLFLTCLYAFISLVVL